MNRTNAKFKNVHWGPDEAKGDRELASYFVQIDEFDDLKDGKYRYIIGRKGSGKTAILEMIRIMASESPTSFVKSLSLKDFPLSILRDLKDKKMEDKSAYVPIWTFLILVELARLVSDDNSVRPVETGLATPMDIVNELKSFISLNFPKDGTFADTLTVLSGKSAKISILANYIGGEYSKNKGSQQVLQLHYQKASEYLLNLLKSVHSSCLFYALFDELDEGYQSSDKGKRLLLLSLLRSIEDLALTFNATSLVFRPMLALRSDIFDKLEDNDLNKLDDYIIRLQWSTDGESGYSLKEVIKHRIFASLKTSVNSSVDAWELIADNGNAYSGLNLWRYICNRTFERPRDIIKFMKICQKERVTDKLTFYTAERALYKYSKWFHDELRDEIQSFLPIWNDVLQCITRIGIDVFEYATFCAAIEEDTTICHWLKNQNKSSLDIIKILFEYSVIGNLRSDGWWSYRYKQSNINFDPKKLIIVHYGFHKHLGIRHMEYKAYLNK